MRFFWEGILLLLPKKEQTTLALMRIADILDYTWQSVLHVKERELGQEAAVKSSKSHQYFSKDKMSTGVVVATTN